MERIREISLTPETFPAQGPSVAAEMRAAWDVVGDDTPVDIAIRFGPSVAARVSEIRWHPSQVTELEADLSAPIAFQLQDSKIWDFEVEGLFSGEVDDYRAGTYLLLG